MASGTRCSGRVLKHEGTCSSRRENAVGKAKDIQGASTSGSTAISTKSKVETSALKDVKISCSSGTGSSTLRKSIRETPSKKKKKEASPSLQKSEILENESLSAPSGSAATDSSSLRKSTGEKPSKKMREARPSSQKPKMLEIEALSTPASATTDSSFMRSSIRETTSKKTREQSPSSRKPERPDNEVLSTPSAMRGFLEHCPSDKKKLEKEDKKHFDSPVRRSERIEMHGTLSSYLKKSKKISRLSGKEKGTDEAAGKIEVSGTGEQSKNKIRAVKSAGPSTKKKRLNTHCYRALLLPPENNAEISDVDSKKLNDDSASKGNSCDSGSMKYDDPKKVQKDEDECTGRRRKIRSKHSDEYSKETVEISSSGSRELAELILQNNEERKSIHLVGKRKRKVEDRSPASNCSDSSSQSSGAEKEINGEDDRICMHSLDKEELEAPELVPTDEGKAIAPSFVDDFGGSKSEKLVDLDSVVAAIPVNEKFVDADPSTVDSFSSPIGIDNEIVKQCPDCCKLQRVGSISQAQELCLCYLQRKNDVPDLSLEAGGHLTTSHFGESIKLPEVESDGVRRKHRKLACNMVDLISMQTWLEDRTTGTSTGKDSCMNDNTTHRSLSISPQKTLCSPGSMLKEPEVDLDRVNAATNDVGLNLHTSSKSDDSAELHNSPTVDLEKQEKLRDVQRSLHLLLKPELAKLCDVLKLPEDAKGLAQRCLEYIMNNLHVSRESETILQALKLSVCWRAASFLKHKVHYTECLALAKKYLNYACDQEQAISVYSKLRLLKETFSQASSLQNVNEPNSSQNQLSASRHVNADQELNGVESNLGPLTLPELGETREILDGPRLSENAVMEQEQDPVLESPSKIQENIGSLKDALLKKRVDLIEKICSKRIEDLLLKQHVELSDCNVHREETKMRLKSVHDSDLVAIQDIHIDYTSRSNNIKLLNEKFSKEMTEYDQHMRSQRSKLAVMQEDARLKEEDIRLRWLEEAKEGILAESFDNFPLTESGFRLEEFKVVTRVAEVCNGSGDFIFVSRPASDQACSDMITTVCLEEDSVLPNRRAESVAVETEVPACQSDKMVLVRFAKAVGALVLRSASDETCNDMIVAGPGEPTGSSTNVLEIPSNTPGERFKYVRINMSDKRGEAESFKPSGTSALVPSSFPLREGVISMEIETLHSQPCTMNAEGSGLSAVLTESALGTVVDRDLQQVEDNSDNTCLISYPQQIQTELQSYIVDAVNSGPDSMLIDSTIATTTSITMLAPISVDRDPRECEESRDGACMLSSLEQNQAEPVPSFSTFSSSVCEVSLILNPISSLNEHERPAASVSTVPDQEGTSQQIAVPALEPVNVVPSQDEQGIQHRSALNSRPFGLPAPVDTSTENSPETPPVVFKSERDPQGKGTDSFALQTEVPMQQPITYSAIQADPTNQLVSHSAVPPLPSFSSNIRPERIPSEHLVSSGAQSDTSLVSPWIAAHVLGSDPLQNELTRIFKQDEFCTKMHEQKKLQLELERDQEIERERERIRKKYEVLIQDAEVGFLQDKKILERVHKNVLLNRVVAEEFRANFIENKGGTASFSGTRLAPTQQFLQSSHMPRAPRPSFPDLAPNSVNPPLLPTLPVQTPSTCPPAGPRAVAYVSPGLMVRHTPSIFSTNQGRPHLMLPPRTSHQLGIEARAPAPHLLRFRPQAPLPNLVPPCTRASMAPVSRAYHQSGVPVVSPISPTIAYTTVQSARGGDPSIIGAVTNKEVAPASSVDARPSGAPADVVCISDEE